MDIPLETIARQNDFVVVDGSIFTPAGSLPEKAAAYLEAMKGISHFYQNFYTDDQIWRELMLNKPQTVEDILQVRVTKKSEWGNVRSIRQWMIGNVNGDGIIDGSKRYPLADVRLASLAFSLAEGGGSVAFLSSDRKLNEFVYSISDKINAGQYPWCFPVWIKGRVDVYSFVRRNPCFISYEEERPRLVHLWASKEKSTLPTS